VLDNLLVPSQQRLSLAVKADGTLGSMPLPGFSCGLNCSLLCLPVSFSTRSSVPAMARTAVSVWAVLRLTQHKLLTAGPITNQQGSSAALPDVPSILAVGFTAGWGAMYLAIELLIRPDSFGHHAKRVKSFNEVNNDIKDQTTNLYI
jgi:hypothetical protein